MIFWERQYGNSWVYLPALQNSQPSSPVDQDSCFQSSSRYSQLKCGQNKTNMESFDEVFRSLSPIFSAIPDTRVFTKEVYPPGIWDIGVLNQLTSFISSNQIFMFHPIKFAPSHPHRGCPSSCRTAWHCRAPGRPPGGTSGSSSSTRGCPTSIWNVFAFQRHMKRGPGLIWCAFKLRETQLYLEAHSSHQVLLLLTLLKDC